VLVTSSASGLSWPKRLEGVDAICKFVANVEQRVGEPSQILPLARSKVVMLAEIGLAHDLLVSEPVTL
jgi:hypothetical protein